MDRGSGVATDGSVSLGNFLVDAKLSRPLWTAEWEGWNRRVKSHGTPERYRTDEAFSVLLSEPIRYGHQ